jgi:hypothetical protein
MVPAKKSDRYFRDMTRRQGNTRGIWRDFPILKAH